MHLASRYIVPRVVDCNQHGGNGAIVVVKLMVDRGDEGIVCCGSGGGAVLDRHRWHVFAVVCGAVAAEHQIASPVGHRAHVRGVGCFYMAWCEKSCA